jgi:hypothetical protein
VSGSQQGTPELDDVAVWQWWCRNAERQGISPTIDDPATISRLITLAFAGTEGGGGRARAS